MNQNTTLIKGFQANERLRKSFNELAEAIFGLHFEKWYELGYWTDKYQPYSFAIGDRVIANVSVNKLTMVVNNEPKIALQIGTVMTHPDYRNQGLSAKLLNQVLEDYAGQYDLMYLFANHTVLDFYPKFGFQRREETQFSMEVVTEGEQSGEIRNLNVQNPEDLQLIYERAQNRSAVSRVFGTINAAELVMFYATYVFPQNIVYIEADEIIAFYKQDEHQLHLFDVISEEPVDFNRLIHQLGVNITKEVIFHFTPDDPTLPLKRSVYQGSDFLFVKHDGAFHFPDFFKHPLTSQA